MLSKQEYKELYNIYKYNLNHTETFNSYSFFTNNRLKHLYNTKHYYTFIYYLYGILDILNKPEVKHKTRYIILNMLFKLINRKIQHYRKTHRIITLLIEIEKEFKRQASITLSLIHI